MTAVSVNITDYKKQIPGKFVGNMWVFPDVNTKTIKGAEAVWVVSVGAIARDSVKLLLAANINDRTTFNDILIDPREFMNGTSKNESYCAFTKVDSWQKVVKGGVGKIKATRPTIVETGKNIGKKNATNVFQQALRDALSDYNKKIQKTSEITIDGRELLPPMLANVYSGTLSNYPVFVQRKYNGLRCVMCLGESGAIIQYSRKRLEFHIEHLADSIEAVFQQYPSIYIDGELYGEGLALEDISGAARNAKPTILLEYNIYDMFDPTRANLPYADRLAIMEKFNLDDVYCHLVETKRVTKHEEIQPLFKQFIDEGYEGAIIRANAPYIYSYNDHHCDNLLKIKLVLDAEFELTGFTEGEFGKGKGQLMLICMTKEKRVFHVTPALTIETRKKLFHDFTNIAGLFKDKYAGHMLIVEFDEYTKDMIPSRARTQMTFRDSSDHSYKITY